MYNRFTDRARKVLQLANQEAQRLNHEYLGTEHILLWLVKEGNGMAAEVMKNQHVDLRKIRLEVEKLVQTGPEMIVMGKLPQTPRAKQVIEYAMAEARDLDHKYVGTEHLLLGLAREQGGVASQVLLILGLSYESVKAETLRILGVGDPEDEDTELRRLDSKQFSERVFRKIKQVLGTHGSALNQSLRCAVREAFNASLEAVLPEAREAKPSGVVQLPVGMSYEPLANAVLGTAGRKVLLGALGNQELLEEVQRRNLLSWSLDTSQQVSSEP